MRERKNANTVVVGIPSGKRHVGRPNHKWEDNIWLRAGINSYEPSGSMRCYEFVE
jgi:hypothetical protein